MFSGVLQAYPEILQVTWRSLVSFVVLFIIMRFHGKQQLSEMTFYEYVSGLTIGSIAATLAVGLESDPIPTFVGLLIYGILVIGMSYIALWSRTVRRIIEGEPVIVIQNGKILEKNMRKMRYSMDALMELLRAKDVFDISEVEFAIVEPSGQLSVLKKSQYQPVTPADLGLPTEYKGITTELVIEGDIIAENLKQVNLDEAWLLAKLKERGIEDVRQVSFAGLDTQGNLYVDMEDDANVDMTDIDDKN